MKSTRRGSKRRRFLALHFHNVRLTLERRGLAFIEGLPSHFVRLEPGRAVEAERGWDRARSSVDADSAGARCRTR
jgi:hypothetical protein